MAGKGDGYRPVDREKFSSNWDAIFGKKEDRETVLEDKNCVKHSDRKTERCDKTVDIEELIDASKDAEK